jgi:glycosyltransferase involved in cell wall biosynthesis
MTPGLVSVVLPVKNGELTVRRAVASALSQSLDAIELVIVEDGSTDGTWSVLQTYRDDARVILLRNETNQGLQKSLNIGWKAAKGEYIARLDADDEWADKDKLRQQRDFLEQHPDYVALGTGTIIVNDAGQEVTRYHKPQADEQIRASLLGSNCFVHASVMMRRTTLEQAGGYDESLSCKHVEDYDLWLRLGQRGKLANLPFYGVRYHLSDSQISNRHKREQFRKNLVLMHKYRRAYPGYFKALVRNLARLLYYGYLKVT